MQKRQIELAKHYGIYGFCYYYYWFNGRTLLDLPLKRILQDRSLDMPFCICWANENWTRRWDGLDQEVLIAQDESVDSAARFIQDVEPFLRDPRYIRIEGKPLLIVYRPNILVSPRDVVGKWREYCRRVGIGELFLVGAETFGFSDPTQVGFDASVEFPPHFVVAQEITSKVTLVNPAFQGRIWSYPNAVELARQPLKPGKAMFRTVMSGWDNTPRRGEKAHIFAWSSPRLFREWLRSACDDTVTRLPHSRWVVFVNAWNEWAEGAYLEPDRRYGYAYLNATASVLRSYVGQAQKRKRRRRRVSVIVPAYNHERYVLKALESLKEQTMKDFEVVVVNDGSTDSTEEVVRQFAKQHGRKFELLLISQENAGAYAAINRGLAESTGEFIGILNSDDFYHPERLETFCRILENSGDRLAFSDVELIDAHGNPVALDHPYGKLLREKITRIAQWRSVEYALLDFNVAISSGNLFFSRDLFDAVGGFNDLRYCHDWDFILTAMRYAKPLFIQKRLYFYRLHGGNTFLSLQSVAQQESEMVLRRFFEFEQNAGLVRDGFPSHRRDGEYFAEFVRTHGYSKYLSGRFDADKG